MPLADWASLRIGGLYQDLSEGRLYNPIKDQTEPRTRNIAVRPSLLLSPAPGLEILLKAEVDRLRDYGNALVSVAQPLDATRAPYPVVGDTGTRYSNYDVAPYYSDELSFMDANLYQADINYDLLGGKLTSTSAWRTIGFGKSGEGGRASRWLTSRSSGRRYPAARNTEFDTSSAINRSPRSKCGRSLSIANREKFM